jgi:hypothetical protein
MTKIPMTVWFHAGSHETVLQSDQPLVAIKTYTNSDGTINLAVFGRDGSLWGRQSIPFLDSGRDGFVAPYSSWAEVMPDDADTSEAFSAQTWQGPPRALGRPAHEYGGLPIDFPGQQDGETVEAFDARKAKYRADPSKPYTIGHVDDARKAQSDIDAARGMDHGAPRGSPSPNSGGPLEIDDHKPTPSEPGPVANLAQATDAKGEQKPKGGWDPTGPAFGSTVDHQPS